MLKYINTILIILFLLPQKVFAADPQIIMDGLNVFGDALGLKYRDIRLIVADLLNEAAGLLGILSVVIIIIAGFMWMLAAGNEDRLARAKKTMVSGLIGLIIVFASFSIADFVLGSLLSIT